MYLLAILERVNRADENGATPACIAAQEGQTAALEILVKAPGCDVNQAETDGLTPAYIAAHNGPASWRWIRFLETKKRSSRLSRQAAK